jgi:hypothetical protein
MLARLRELTREREGPPTPMQYWLLGAAVLALLLLVGVALESYAHLSAGPGGMPFSLEV